MENINRESLKNNFNFLLSSFNFKLNEIKDYDYALYAKFLSSSVGIYIIYEFRDFIPQIQFSLLNTDGLVARAGLYTIRELYKDENFHLKSFYLDEIVSFKKGDEYKSYFKDVKTIEEALKISKELMKKYAEDFVVGDVESYAEIDDWFRVKVMSS